MAEKRRGLGRGLGALIPNVASLAEENNTDEPQTLFEVPAVEKPVQSPAPESVVDAPKKHENNSSKGEIKESEGVKPASVSEESSQGNVNVSRETSTSSSQSSRKTSASKSVKVDRKADRMDMGAALRNTTLTRRPVDFFFGEDVQAPGASAEQLVPVPGASFATLKIADIHPNRKQPRVDFDEQDMEELVHSIREIGVLQPIVVRPSREEDREEKYELVMGERRWRASQRAGLDTIPAIIRDTQDEDLLRDALLENLHRSQLNPIEEAAAYQQLMEEFGATQEQLAQRIGRSRPQVTNTIRLLKLPALVQRRVAVGILSAGHARALLALKDPAQMETLAQKIVNEGLSVRAVESLVAENSGQEPAAKRPAAQPQKHHERLDYIADAFADKLDTQVKISLGARKGKMTIEFANVEDLNRIIRVLDSSFES